MRVHNINDGQRAGQGAGAGLALNPNLGAGGNCLPPLPQVPVLKLMYDAGARASSENYMLLILLLILTHDAIYSSNIHSPVPIHALPLEASSQGSV